MFSIDLTDSPVNAEPLPLMTNLIFRLTEGISLPENHTDCTRLAIGMCHRMTKDKGLQDR